MKHSECTLCSLRKHRTQVVLPKIVGTPEYGFIGEAPGKNEDKSGEPFVGAAGQWEKRIRKFLGINNNYFITNVVSCRPVVLDGNGKIVKNGKPTAHQMMKCSVWLDKLIERYKVRLLILYGDYATRQVLGFYPPLYSYVGKFFESSRYGNKKCFVLYHPACLVYDKKMYKPKFNKHLTHLKTFIHDV